MKPKGKSQFYQKRTASSSKLVGISKAHNNTNRSQFHIVVHLG